MQTNVIIGNVISFGASVSLLLSCCINNEKKAYFFQMMESLLLSISSVFFLSWSGVSTMLIATIRNILVLKDKFNKKYLWIFVALTVGIGLAVNRRGLIGILPIISTVQITVCNLLARRMVSIKLSFLVNIIIYMIYSFAILDFASGIGEAITALICIVSIFKLMKENRKKSDEINRKLSEVR